MRFVAHTTRDIKVVLATNRLARQCLAQRPPLKSGTRAVRGVNFQLLVRGVLATLLTAGASSSPCSLAAGVRAHGGCDMRALLPALRLAAAARRRPCALGP
jgi:hypothetical protein